MIEDHCIFVGDLTPEVDDNMLFLYFALKYPTCMGAKIIRDPLNETRGFGFVQFSSRREKKKAMAENNGRYGLGNKPLKINDAFQKISTGIPDMTYLLNQYKINHPHLFYNASPLTPAIIQKPARKWAEGEDELCKFYETVEGKEDKSKEASTATSNQDEGMSSTSLPIVQQDETIKIRAAKNNPNDDLFDAESLQQTADFYSAQNTTISIIPLSNLNANVLNLDPAYQNYHHKLMQQQNSMYMLSGMFQTEPLKAPNIYPDHPPMLKDNPNETINYYSNLNSNLNNNTAHPLNHLGLVQAHAPGTTSGSFMIDKMNEEFMNCQYGELYESLERSRWQPIDFQSNNFIALDF